MIGIDQFNMLISCLSTQLDYRPTTKQHQKAGFLGWQAKPICLPMTGWMLALDSLPLLT